MKHLFHAPLSLSQANAVVLAWHRHHKPARGQRFAVGAFVVSPHTGDATLVGAAIVGRPVGREVDQWMTAEVTRCVTDGTPDACSFLYGTAERVARAWGFTEIRTYTLPEESGASLRAVGWTCDGVVRHDGRGWENRPGPHADQPQGPKIRWRKALR